MKFFSKPIEPEPSYYVRWMIRRDMEAVAEMEAATFAHPWTEKEFQDCLRRQNAIGLVVEFDGEIVGYVIYELHKWHVNVINFVVHPDCKRNGIGVIILAKLKQKLSAERRNRITLDISETNLSGQLFFKAQGFVATRVIANRYDVSDEAAYVMEFRLPVESTCVEPVNRIKSRVI